MTDSDPNPGAPAGDTWSAPQNLSRFYGSGAPPSPQCSSTFAGGHGIQLQGGAKRGRLLVPGYHIHACTRNGSDVVEFSHVWFSDDHGATWSRSSEFGFGTAEGSLVELFESSAGGGRPLRASLRVDSPSKCKCVGRNGSVPAAYVKHCRRNALSRDGGDTWSDLHDLASLPDPGVRGGMTTAPAHRAIVVTNPNNESVRTNMSVHVSVNDGATYGSSLQFWEGVGGYSDVARHPYPARSFLSSFPGAISSSVPRLLKHGVADP